MSNEKENVSEDVGYMKPPERTRWQKGQSGNRKGRPKNSKNLLTLLNALANEEIKVQHQNGKTVKMPKKAVALLKAMNAACSDPKALKMLMPYLAEADAKAEEQDRKEQVMSQTDEAIINEYFYRKNKGDEDVNRT